MKNKNNNNESNTKKNINKSNNINKENNKNVFELKQRMNKAENLFEYFAIIGLDPEIASKNFLYELSDISKYPEELKPKLICKYPPIEKPYINIDENICELCFPEGIKIEKYKNKPKPEIYRYLLGNYFYSIEHPLRYLTCLKFYESLDKYKILQRKIEKINENKNNSFDNDINTISKEKNNNYINNNIKRNKSQNTKKVKNLKNNYLFTEEDNDALSQYYIPKIICFFSLKPHYKLQEKILLQLYNYCNIKKIKIPVEKIILNILINIPNPPRGIHIYQYNMSEDFKKLEIKSEKMNKIKNFDDELKIIFEYFNIDNFLEIFRYTLFETKAIIFSSKINHLCSLIHGLISILYPFVYPFQVSSCIREDAFQLLESISPYILGINQKYTDHFFSDNNIEIKSANFLIIDLDNKEYIINTVEELPEIPKTILKKVKTRIEINLDKNEIKGENEEENTITFAFYEFFLNILINYSEFLNNDNLKKNFKISNLKILFKTKEFIESHPFNERPFYKRLTETQMFNDFIFKKMIPKDIEDKLDILLFDENINKINNTKKKFFFFKNKSTSFLSTKEYDFKNIHKIPKVKELLKEELDKYKNKNYYKNNLIKGQDIIIEKNDYFFNYILFPKLNTDFYNYPSNEFFIYYYTIENIKNDINRVNTDLIAKSSIKYGNENTLLDEGEVMLDYIYLTYIEVWGYSFWYQDLSERDFRFKQLLEVLDKIKRQEIELFNVLFEILNKFHEKRKIRKLYNKIMEYKLTPDSFIYSIVGKNIKKNEIDDNINYNIFLGKKEEKNNFQPRTFKSEKDINIIGNNIYHN